MNTESLAKSIRRAIGGLDSHEYIDRRIASALESVAVQLEVDKLTQEPQEDGVYPKLCQAYRNDFQLPSDEPIPEAWADAFRAVDAAVCSADNPEHDLRSFASVLETAAEIP